MTDERRKYIRDFDSKNYEALRIKPKREVAEQIKNHAAKRGESVTRFIVRACENQIKLDNVLP